MTFILRWLMVLVLLVFVALNLFPAVMGTLVQTNLIDVSKVSESLQALSRNTDLVGIALWYGAAVFLLITAIRLMRRTRSFWTWLIGFALYTGHWAMLVQSDPENRGGVMGYLQSLTADSFRLDNILGNPNTTGLAAVVTLLVIGILILLVHGNDHRELKSMDL